MQNTKRVGFTLVELLVVIAIIGILIGMLLPAVQQVREAARRTTCLNNLKQLGLAMQNFANADETLPSAGKLWLDQSGWRRDTWFYDILPFVEQANMQDIYEAHLEGPQTGSFSYTNLALEVKNTAIASFMCTSDPFTGKIHVSANGNNDQGFHGNYVACAGNARMKVGNNKSSSGSQNGVIYPRNQTRFSDILDGMSNTLLASELLVTPESDTHNDVRGRYHNGRHTGTGFSSLYTPNTSVSDRFNFSDPTYEPAPAINSGTNVVVSARSFHPGGVNTALCDGSTRFQSDQISVSVWNALGSRDGGDSVSQ